MNCYPDGKEGGANMGSIWVRSDPDGPHIGPMNLAIRIPNHPGMLKHQEYLNSCQITLPLWEVQKVCPMSAAVQSSFEFSFQPVLID